jgi:hypothetical protein
MQHEYIIELNRQQQETGFNDLELDWSHQPADQMLQLEIQVANDIDHWKTLHVAKRLSNKEGTNPEWRRIGAIPRGYKYIRLTPAKETTEFSLLQVIGVNRTTKPLPLLWHRLQVLQPDPVNPEFYPWRLPSALAPVQLRLMPQLPHQIIKGDIYASRDDLEHKRLVRSGIRQHSIPDSAGIVASPGINASGLGYSNWWFKPEQGLDTQVAVELGYRPVEILFLPNNNGPYTLFWGNIDAAAPANELIPLLGKQSQAHKTEPALVDMGPVEMAAGPSRLHLEKPAEWGKWLLWLLLLAAIMITARMAYHLYRDLKLS